MQLRWLLDCHPEVGTGIGIAHFSIRSALYDTRCFAVVRTNSETISLGIVSMG